MNRSTRPFMPISDTQINYEDPDLWCEPGTEDFAMPTQIGVAIAAAFA